MDNLPFGEEDGEESYYESLSRQLAEGERVRLDIQRMKQDSMRR